MENLIILANEVSKGLFEFWYGKLIIGLIVGGGILVIFGFSFLIAYIVGKIKERKEEKKKRKENDNGKR